jgi:hypothetical protein
MRLVPTRSAKVAIIFGMLAACGCGESSDSTRPPTATGAASTDQVPTRVTDTPSTIDKSATNASTPHSSAEIGEATDGTVLQASDEATQWQAPGNGFVIGALPAGFVTRGSPQIVDAVGSPNGDGVVSQTFVNVGQGEMVTVSLESGAYVTQQLASSDMTTRTDIVDGANVLVSIDATTGQQAIAWQPADDRISGSTAQVSQTTNCSRSCALYRSLRPSTVWRPERHNCRSRAPSAPRVCAVLCSDSHLHRRAGPGNMR